MSNSFVNTLESLYNYKQTENGALAHKSTLSKVYDLFALGGAYRQRSDEDCITLFKNAYDEDPDLAIKCLFYLRDCRGGQGERRFFRVCFKWLASYDSITVLKNFDKISEFGRWDDLFIFLDTDYRFQVADLIKTQLTLDMEDCLDGKGISLLAKWMPSENAHSEETKKKATWFRKYLGMTSKQYRKMLSKLRNHLKVLEKLMSENRWDEIEFDKIPSKAGLVYRNAFARRDILAKKYEAFAKDKNTTVNAKVLYPYEVVNEAIWAPYSDGDEINRAMINKYWDNLPDYFEGKSSKMLCVVDTSGSMRWGGGTSINPIDVAISLGMYAGEHMQGEFGGKYISFSREPKLINIKDMGHDFVRQVHNIYRTNICENTNLEAVFQMILSICRNKNVKQEDIPETIVVISDMEIDRMSYWGTESSMLTDMESIHRVFEYYGVKMPRLVYWNVCARNDTILDLSEDVSLVSGASPILFKSVLTGKTGIDLMKEILLSDRYKEICA